MQFLSIVSDSACVDFIRLLADNVLLIVDDCACVVVIPLFVGNIEDVDAIIIDRRR